MWEVVAALVNITVLEAPRSVKFPVDAVDAPMVVASMVEVAMPPVGVKTLFEVRVVNVPAAGVDPPIMLLLTVPPVTVKASATWASSQSKTVKLSYANSLVFTLVSLVM